MLAVKLLPCTTKTAVPMYTNQNYNTYPSTSRCLHSNLQISSFIYIPTESVHGVNVIAGNKTYFHCKLFFPPFVLQKQRPHTDVFLFVQNRCTHNRQTRQANNSVNSGSSDNSFRLLSLPTDTSVTRTVLPRLSNRRLPAPFSAL